RDGEESPRSSTHSSGGQRAAGGRRDGESLRLFPCPLPAACRPLHFPTSVAAASSVSASAPDTTTRSPSWRPTTSALPPDRPPTCTGMRLTRKRLNRPSEPATTNTAAPSLPATIASSGTVITDVCGSSCTCSSTPVPGGGTGVLGAIEATTRDVPFSLTTPATSAI